VAHVTHAFSDVDSSAAVSCLTGTILAEEEEEIMVKPSTVAQLANRRCHTASRLCLPDTCGQHVDCGFAVSADENVYEGSCIQKRCSYVKVRAITVTN